MHKTPGRIALLSSLALIVAAVAACTPQNPEQRVAAMRAKYEAKLIGFVAKHEPPAPSVEPAPQEEERELTPADLDQPIAPPEVQELPLTVDVVLDILVTNQNNEALPGLTVDVSQVDAAKQEKGHWRIWVDTSKVGRGPGTSVTHTLPGVDYVEGDGFLVEVVNPVPADAQGEYKEFTALP